MSEGRTDPIPSARTKKNRMFRRLYVPLAITAVLTVILGSCSLVIWLPDAVPPHEWKHVGGAVLPNDRELHLFQKWGDDFYLTAIAVKEMDRYREVYFIDGDDVKQWRFNVRLQPNQQQATISLPPGRTFTYSWVGGELFAEGFSEASYNTKYTAQEFESSFGPLPKATTVSP